MPAPPEYPSYFLKPASAVSHHLAEVARPRGCEFLNYEGEIAAVIGRRCKGVTRAEALGYVAGYTIANDFATSTAVRCSGSRGRTASARWVR
jgi:5-oxopent-3-ene-1,2,5-tricarboxylate decarboxylase/2-hydroxyhepta-2,4-diene-1,7-dioate isomerase